MIAALKQHIARNQLPGVPAALGLRALTIAELRRKTPDYAAAELGRDRAELMTSTWETLCGSLRLDEQTYRVLLESLPHVLGKKYEAAAPASASELTDAWIECVTESQTYACQICVSAVRHALRARCGIGLRLVMCDSKGDARSRPLDYSEDAITLIHLADKEHYMWVSAARKRRRGA